MLGKTALFLFLVKSNYNKIIKGENRERLPSSEIKQICSALYATMRHIVIGEEKYEQE